MVTKKNNKIKSIMKNGLIIDKYGTKLWYKDNLLHNENGPAVEFANGDKQWFINGKLHRLDGPAVETSDKNKEWWYKGNIVFCSSLKEFKKAISNKGGWITCYTGRIHYQNGIMHNDKGPAIKNYDGTKCWIFNGFTHRIDGPAFTNPNPNISDEWYYQGKKK